MIWRKNFISSGVIVSHGRGESQSSSFCYGHSRVLHISAEPPKATGRPARGGSGPPEHFPSTVQSFRNDCLWQPSTACTQYRSQSCKSQQQPDQWSGLLLKSVCPRYQGKLLLP